METNAFEKFEFEVKPIHEDLINGLRAFVEIAFEELKSIQNRKFVVLLSYIHDLFVWDMEQKNKKLGLIDVINPIPHLSTDVELILSDNFNNIYTETIEKFRACRTNIAEKIISNNLINDSETKKHIIRMYNSLDKLSTKIVNSMQEACSEWSQKFTQMVEYSKEKFIEENIKNSLKLIEWAKNEGKLQEDTEKILKMVPNPDFSSPTYKEYFTYDTEQNHIFGTLSEICSEISADKVLEEVKRNIVNLDEENSKEPKTIFPKLNPESKIIPPEPVPNSEPSLDEKIKDVVD